MSFAVALPRLCSSSRAHTSSSLAHTLCGPATPSVTTLSRAFSLAARAVSTQLTSPSVAATASLARRRYSPPPTSRPPPRAASLQPKTAQRASPAPGSSRPPPSRPRSAPPKLALSPGQDAQKPPLTLEPSERLQTLRVARVRAASVFRRSMPWADQVELRTLEDVFRLATFEQDEKIAFSNYGYIPLNENNPSKEVIRWRAELAAQSVKQETIWDHFAIRKLEPLRLLPNAAEQPVESKPRPKLGIMSPFHWKVVLVLTIIGVSVDLVARSYSSPNALEPSYPSTELFLGLLFFAVPAVAVLLVSGAPSRVAARQALNASRSSRVVPSQTARFAQTTDDFIMRRKLWTTAGWVQCSPLQFHPSQIWLSALAHADGRQCFHNLFQIFLFGFVAWGFFDHREFLQKSELYEKYIRHDDNAGLITRLGRLLGLSADAGQPLEDRVVKTIDPCNHFIFFGLAAIAIANCVNLLHLARHELPAARRTLAATLNSPALQKTHRPTLYLDPATDRIVFGDSLAIRYVRNWGGISDMTYATGALCILQTTIGAWNPLYLGFLPLQAFVARRLYQDAKLASLGANPHGSLGHVPGTVFGIIWFFIGYYVWDFTIGLFTKAPEASKGSEEPSVLDVATDTAAYVGTAEQPETTPSAGSASLSIADEQLVDRSSLPWAPSPESIATTSSSSPTKDATVEEPAVAKSGGWKLW